MARSSPPDSDFDDPRSNARYNDDGLSSLHSATAMTDYDAFTGKEEYLSSNSSSPPKQKTESRAKAKKSRKVRRALDSSNTPARSLRPALDVLSRLRHDPSFSSQAFTIGYLDRHSPEVMELPLTDWKGGEITDEEFIPQHRILWFKRNVDGKKVWDRKARYDEVFGSGVVPASGVEEIGAGGAADADADSAISAQRTTTKASSEDASLDIDRKEGEAKPGMSTEQTPAE